MLTKVCGPIQTTRRREMSADEVIVVVVGAVGVLLIVGFSIEKDVKCQVGVSDAEHFQFGARPLFVSGRPPKTWLDSDWKEKDETSKNSFVRPCSVRVSKVQISFQNPHQRQKRDR